MYKLTEDSFEIQTKITPKSLRVLKELGLLKDSLGQDGEITLIIELFTEPEKFEKLVNTIFIIDKKIDYDIISLEEFLKGYLDFFARLTKSFEKSAD